MKKSERLLINSILNLAGNTAPLLIGIIAIPYIIKGMGLEKFGILSLSWVFFSYFGIFDLGIGRASIKFISESYAINDREGISNVFWASIYSQTIIGIILGAAGYLILPYIVKNFFKFSPSLTIESIKAFRILSLLLPIILLSSGLKNTLEAFQRFDLVNFVKIPANILFFIFPLIFSKSSLGFIIITLGLVRLATAIIYGIICFNLTYADLKSDITFHLSALKKILSMGFWITISSIASPILLYIERFFIASFSPPENLSYYSVSYDTLSRMPILAVSAAAALYPAFSYENVSSKENTYELLTRPLKYLIIIMTPAVFILYIFSKPILTIWLGKNFLTEGLEVFRILLLTFYLNSLAVIPFMAVQGLGRADLKAKFDVIASVFFIFVAGIFTYHFQIAGAAYSKLLLTLTDTAFLTFIALRLTTNTDILPRLSKFVYTSLSSLILLFMSILVIASNPSLPYLIFISVILLTLYGFLIYTKSIDENDITIFKNILKRFSPSYNKFP